MKASLVVELLQKAGEALDRVLQGRWVAGCADAPDVSAARSGDVAGSDRPPETVTETITAGLTRGGAGGPNILPRLQLHPVSPRRTLLIVAQESGWAGLRIVVGRALESPRCGLWNPLWNPLWNRP